MSDIRRRLRQAEQATEAARPIDTLFAIQTDDNPPLFQARNKTYTPAELEKLAESGIRVIRIVWAEPDTWPPAELDPDATLITWGDGNGNGLGVGAYGSANGL